jgi:hypothetical protein
LNEALIKIAEQFSPLFKKKRLFQKKKASRKTRGCKVKVMSATVSSVTVTQPSVTMTQPSVTMTQPLVSLTQPLTQPLGTTPPFLAKRVCVGDCRSICSRCRKCPTCSCACENEGRPIVLKSVAAARTVHDAAAWSGCGHQYCHDCAGCLFCSDKNLACACGERQPQLAKLQTKKPLK